MLSGNVASGSPFAEEIRTLFRVALGVFAVTVLIGIVNGQGVVQLDRATLLTHVHAGTLGWITLSVFAVVLWLFSIGESATDGEQASVRRLSRASAAAVTCYVLAFFLFYPGPRFSSPIVLAVFGTLAMVAILAFLVWTIRRSRRVPMGLARLGALGAMTNLAIGAVLGVGIEAKLSGIDFPGNVFASHPGMMTVGYLIPIGMAIAEWRLKSGLDARRPLVGTLQIGLPIVGGWFLAVGLLFNVLPLTILATLCEVIAAVLFVIRIGPSFVRIAWAATGGERLVAVSSVGLLGNVVLLVYLLANYAEDFEKVPPGLFLTLDHVTFVGMMTNALFASINLATADRRGEHAWADHVLFLGMNVGLVGFAVGLWTETAALKAVFTPIMGLSILVALVVYAMRLRGQAVAARAAVAA